MSSAAVTYNFTNGLTADAEQVDQNFADLVNIFNSHALHKDTDAISDGLWIADAAGVVKFKNAGDNGKKTQVGSGSGTILNGTNSISTTITFGSSFADTSYRLVVMPRLDSTNFANVVIRVKSVGSATAYLFTLNNVGADTTVNYDWIATGA